MDLFEKLSDDKPPDQEEKVDTGEEAELHVLCQEIKTLLELIGNNTVRMYEEIGKTKDASADVTVVERYEHLINKQRERLSGDLNDKLKQRMKMGDTGVDPSYSKVQLSNHISAFSKAQFEKLDTMEMVLVHKVKPRTVTSPSPGARSPETSSEKVQLTKTKPPVFTKGDIEEYPEFKRKWKALVSPAKLPAEAELDKLRDAVPKHFMVELQWLRLGAFLIRDLATVNCLQRS